VKKWKPNLKRYVMHTCTHPRMHPRMHTLTHVRTHTRDANLIVQPSRGIPWVMLMPAVV